jgi:predicted phosphohydrolase
MNIYGNIPGQKFDLRGTSDQFSGLVNARTADLVVKGNPTLSGIYWVNNLAISGTANFISPDSGGCAPGSLCDILRKIYGLNAQLVFDYKIRSPLRTWAF